MLFTIIEVFKNIIKNNSNQALMMSILLMFSIRIVSKESSQLFSPILFFSFISYFLMFTIALEALKKNKIIGIYLFITIFFIPPNILPEYKGLLFPITYLSHFTYLGYLISLELFNKWKKSHEL